MLSRLVVAIALALTAAATQASDPVRIQPGETVASFQCRATFVPEARACAARCDAAFAGDATARFECVHSCTKHGLYEIAACRANGAPPAAAAAMVASR